MQTAAQRTAARSLRRLRPQVQRQSRRHASDSHGHSQDHGHGAPANESFGLGFYLSLGAIPASYALYLATKADGEKVPYFSRLIQEKYNEYQDSFTRRNVTHMTAMEHAAEDRALFLSEPNRSIRHVELRFPEQFNQGSPFNVPAGHGYANMDELIEKYRREAAETEAKKMEKLRENKVPAEQYYEPLHSLRKR